ncbi:hypothetical protein ACL1FG_01045 [Corynebacterium striatum]
MVVHVAEDGWVVITVADFEVVHAQVDCGHIGAPGAADDSWVCDVVLREFADDLFACGHRACTCEVMAGWASAL